MRNLLVCALCVCLLLVAAPVFSQCTNGSCPSGKCPSAIPAPISPSVNVTVDALAGYLMPYRQQQAAKDAELEAKLDAVLRAVEAGKAAPVAPQGLQGKIEAQKEALKEKIDPILDSPILKTLAAFLTIVALCLLGHAIYAKCHADKAKIDEKLKDNPALKDLFDKMDDFNTKIDNKLHGVKEEPKASQSDLVKVALATPAPSQVTPVAPVAAPVVAAK